MNIAAYCRVSTNKEDQINSLETQRRFFEEYAQKNGYSLIRIYADEGISGTKTKNRAEFLKMMRDSQDGLFEMVVVKDISRLARNAVDFLQGIRYLKANGVACNFVNANLTSQDSEMVLGTLALVAQEESANTSRRIKMSKRMNAEKGRVPNIVYGYDKTPGDYFSLAVNEREAEIVRRIYGMYINENYGAGKIAMVLNSEGLRTKRGCLWSQNAVSRILTNEIYIGRIINGKEEVKDFLTGVRIAKEECEWIITRKSELRIIDDETFEHAAKVLSQRRETFNIKHERQCGKHLFSTLIKCGSCGHSYRRRVRTYKNTYTDWICAGRSANGAESCPNKTAVSEEELIKALENFFLELLADKPGVIKNLTSNIKKLQRTQSENEATEKELSTQLKKLKRIKQKYIDMYVDEVITRVEMCEKLEILNVQIEKTGCELAAYEQLAGIADVDFGTEFWGIDRIISLEGMSNSQLKRIIEKIVAGVNGEIDIHLRRLAE